MWAKMICIFKRSLWVTGYGEDLGVESSKTAVRLLIIARAR